MAKKIIIDRFGGERPRVPNDKLPNGGASIAVNTRLSNTELRPFATIEDSVDTNSVLSTLSSAYTNFVKVSKEDGINWMAWITPEDVPILEVRYNDVESYPEISIPRSTPDGILNVLFAGLYTLLDSNNNFVAARSLEFKSAVPLTLNQTITQRILASIEVELAPIDTYLWEFVSGDVGITCSDPALANPVFTSPSLPPPIELGVENGSTSEAVWRCTILDTSGNPGQKEVTISYNYWWGELADYGGGGGGRDPFDPDPPTYREN